MPVQRQVAVGLETRGVLVQQPLQPPQAERDRGEIALVGAPHRPQTPRSRRKEVEVDRIERSAFGHQPVDVAVCALAGIDQQQPDQLLQVIGTEADRAAAGTRGERQIALTAMRQHQARDHLAFDGAQQMLAPCVEVGRRGSDRGRGSAAGR